MAKKLINRILNMCDPAYSVLRGVMMISCVMEFCAFVILIDIEPVTSDKLHLFQLARELSTTPAALMIIGAIGTVLIEEQYIKSGK